MINDCDKPTSNLKRIRESLSLSQSDLSILAEVPLTTIQRYEQRKINLKNARAEYVVRIAKALDYHPTALFD